MCLMTLYWMVMKMINAFLIILAAAVYLFACFVFAWFLGKLIHFGMNDEKEVEQHDDDA